MNGFIRRLIKLEPPEAERPLRIIWNDGSGTAHAEADALGPEPISGIPESGKG